MKTKGWYNNFTLVNIYCIELDYVKVEVKVASLSKFFSIKKRKNETWGLKVKKYRFEKCGNHLRIRNEVYKENLELSFLSQAF